MNAAAFLAPTDHRETSDTYGGELFRMGAFRVAICGDGIQWLYQRQDPANPLAGARWRTLGFCTTRQALMRLQAKNMQSPSQDIAALPERIIRKGGAA